ncbi:MAG TPA: glycosyl hydrolase family 8 [Lacunisphaera sp.]|nr:glycosyl hydrolase family 8 [Lacunisphaera sp.]
MKLLRLLLIFLGWTVAHAASPAAARNLFSELLGKSEVELDAKLAAAWHHFFAGTDHQRVYFPVGSDMAYIADIGNGDVRSEGMSYGMMLAVQLDKRDEFDRLWRWANKYMRHASGPRKGYFAWQCAFDGTVIDPGSASDGEEWFATALFFAAHRWGNGAGILNYGSEAQTLLRDMLHKPGSAEAVAIFNREARQVVFAPNPVASRFTDPSYHLPAFYELWARWSDNPSDRAVWSEAANVSRAFFHRAAHPQTGLMPEYAHFSGDPFTSTGYGGGKGDFRYDAWRTLANVALDHAWWRADPWQVEQSNRVLGFLGGQEKLVNQYTLDGKPLSSDGSLGLVAMAAVAGQAADPNLAKPFVQRLWEAPLPEGKWRYYNGTLYFLALLQAGGRFQAFPPPSAR